MVPVYDAANSTDAYLIKNILEQAGIACFIRGEYLQGGLGDLPVTGMIQACVAPGDAERARAIVVDWNDNASLPLDDDDDASDRAPESDVVPGRPAFGRMLFAGLLGTLVGATVAWAWLRAPEMRAVDYNDDGRPDERVFLAGDGLQRIETDNNHDGKVDAITWYDADGNSRRSQSDYDFDGRLETQSHFLHGQWLGDEADEDGDGAIDYKADAVSGAIFSQEWFDAQNRVIKRVQYKGIAPVSGEIDTNGDGVLDTRRAYDRSGEITRSERM